MMVTKRRRVTVGVVNGVLTTLPADFSFPKSLTARQMVYSWFIGNDDRQIVPYRRLSAKDVKHVSGGQEYRRKMVGYMKAFKHYAKVEGCWIEKDPTPNQVKRMWESVTSKYLYRLYGADDISRPHTGGWFSFFNRMSRRGAFRKTRDTCTSDEEWSRSIYNPSNVERYVGNESEHLAAAAQQ